MKIILSCHFIKKEGFLKPVNSLVVKTIHNRSWEYLKPKKTTRLCRRLKRDGAKKNIKYWTKAANTELNEKRTEEL